MKIRTIINGSNANINNINALESRAAQAGRYFGCKQPECFIFSEKKLNELGG